MKFARVRCWRSGRVSALGVVGLAILTLSCKGPAEFVAVYKGELHVTKDSPLELYASSLNYNKEVRDLPSEVEVNIPRRQLILRQGGPGDPPVEFVFDLTAALDGLEDKSRMPGNLFVSSDQSRQLADFRFTAREKVLSRNVREKTVPCELAFLQKLNRTWAGIHWIAEARADDWFMNPANPASPLSPLNPANPASPLNPIHSDSSSSKRMGTKRVLAEVTLKQVETVFEFSRPGVKAPSVRLTSLSAPESETRVIRDLSVCQ